MALKKIRVSRKPKPYIAYEVTIKNLPQIEKELDLPGYEIVYEKGKPVSVRFKDPNLSNSYFLSEFGLDEPRLIGIDDRGEVQIFNREMVQNELDLEEL